MKSLSKSRKSVEYYTEGILKGDRVVLAQAITLAESSLAADEILASQLLSKILKNTGNSIRIGITGSPGVGKSTFIESFGKFLTGLGKKVAVLAVDPSSQKSRGSILGDKTRMADLSIDPNAFVRPSSSGETLGGVANKTREAMLLCEAAGYEIILVETVGVGQSEVAVKNMTDFFLLLMLPGSGDELQGIKKGIMEMADLVIITKADGETIAKAKQSQADFLNAIHTLYAHVDGWVPKVLTVSSTKNEGLEVVYSVVNDFVESRKATGKFTATRASQSVTHMHDNFDQLLRSVVQHSPLLRNAFDNLEEAVRLQSISPAEGARQMLQHFKEHLHGSKS